MYRKLAIIKKLEMLFFLPLQNTHISLKKSLPFHADKLARMMQNKLLLDSTWQQIHCKNCHCQEPLNHLHKHKLMTRIIHLRWVRKLEKVLASCLKLDILSLMIFSSNNKLLYYSLVYPFLTSGLIFWGNTYSTTLSRVVKLNRVLC